MQRRLHTTIGQIMSAAGGLQHTGISLLPSGTLNSRQPATVEPHPASLNTYRNSHMDSVMDPLP